MVSIFSWRCSPKYQIVIKQHPISICVLAADCSRSTQHRREGSYRTGRPGLGLGHWVPLGQGAPVEGVPYKPVHLVWRQTAMCIHLLLKTRLALSETVVNYSNVLGKSMCCPAGRIKGAAQWDTQNRSWCSLSLTRLRCSESGGGPWGSRRGLQRRSYLWESCGKVFLLGSGSQTRRHQSGRQTERGENVREYRTFWRLDRNWSCCWDPEGVATDHVNL